MIAYPVIALHLVGEDCITRCVHSHCSRVALASRITLCVKEDARDRADRVESIKLPNLLTTRLLLEFSQQVSRKGWKGIRLRWIFFPWWFVRLFAVLFFGMACRCPRRPDPPRPLARIQACDNGSAMSRDIGVFDGEAALTFKFSPSVFSEGTRIWGTACCAWV